jgi:hypothetical protein
MVKPKRNVSFSNEFFKVYLSDFSSRQLVLSLFLYASQLGFLFSQLGIDQN